MTTDNFAAFPDAPVPTTLRGALDMLEETRRLLAEECRQRAAAVDQVDDLTARLQDAAACWNATLGTQEENKALRTGLRRVADWLGAASHSADDIIAAINRSDDAHSKDLVKRTTERDVLRRAFEHLRGVIEGIIDTDDLLALRDTVGETCNEVGLRRGLNHETGDPDYQWVAVT